MDLEPFAAITIYYYLVVRALSFCDISPMGYLTGRTREGAIMFLVHKGVEALHNSPSTATGQINYPIQYLGLVSVVDSSKKKFLTRKSGSCIASPETTFTV